MLVQLFHYDSLFPQVNIFFPLVTQWRAGNPPRVANVILSCLLHLNRYSEKRDQLAVFHKGYTALEFL